jgi:hypothetical protein
MKTPQIYTCTRKITRENIDDSLSNGDLNPIHSNAKKASEFLKAINYPITENVVVVPGMLSLLNIEFLDEIRHMFPLGISDVNFSGILVVEDKPKASIDVEYELIERIMDDPPPSSYDVIQRQNGRETLRGNIKVTGKAHYKLITNEKINEKVKVRQVSPDSLNQNKLSIDSMFSVDKEFKERTCRSLNIDGGFYDDKYDGKTSRMTIAAKITAQLYDIVKNEKGFFLYKKQGLRILKGDYGNNFQMSGIRENLKDTVYNIGLIIKSNGNSIIESYSQGARFVPLPKAPLPEAA